MEERIVQKALNKYIVGPHCETNFPYNLINRSVVIDCRKINDGHFGYIDVAIRQKVTFEMSKARFANAFAFLAMAERFSLDKFLISPSLNITRRLVEIVPVDCELLNTVNFLVRNPPRNHRISSEHIRPENAFAAVQCIDDVMDILFY